MEAQKINTAIVILTFNGINWLKKFLPVLVEKSKGVNIYVADNASSDGTIEFVNTNYPNIAILQNYLNEGYVTRDDWNSDPNELLKEMNQTSKDDVKNIKWIFEPQLSDDNYAYYSYEVLWDDGDRTIETAILSFGRKGYHEIKFLKKINLSLEVKKISIKYLMIKNLMKIAA